MCNCTHNLMPLGLNCRTFSVVNRYSPTGVFSRYCIYIFAREEGSLSCLRLTQRVTLMSTTRLYRGYINWG
jgi:hypothetical protein